MNKAVIGKNIISGEEVFFSSAAEAEKAGFNRFSISRCCGGKGKTHNGYLWQFFDGNSGWGKIERNKRINVLRFIKDFLMNEGFLHLYAILPKE